MDIDTASLQKTILDNFYTMIGEAKASLTDSDLKNLQTVAKDAAMLTLKSLAGDKASERELKLVNAILANLAIAKYFPVRNVFWSAVERAGVVLLTTLTKAAISAAISAAV